MPSSAPVPAATQVCIRLRFRCGSMYTKTQELTTITAWNLSKTDRSRYIHKRNALLHPVYPHRATEMVVAPLNYEQTRPCPFRHFFCRNMSPPLHRQHPRKAEKTWTNASFANILYEIIFQNKLLHYNFTQKGGHKVRSWSITIYKVPNKYVQRSFQHGIRWPYSLVVLYSTK